MTKTGTTVEGLAVSGELIEGFLEDLAARGRSEGTRKTYRRKLSELMALLPEDRVIRQGTLLALRGRLQEQGMPNATINIFCSAANSLLEYAGRRDLQLAEMLTREQVIAPELTRTEYLRLLSAARTLGQERTYLLIKSIAHTGISVRELPQVTAEALAAGQLVCAGRGIVPLPGCLRGELQDYVRRTGIASGPVFLTLDGHTLSRSAVSTCIRRLSGSARVEPGKCNPLALRRLYFATREQIAQSLAMLAEQSMNRLLESEQLSIGWEA